MRKQVKHNGPAEDPTLLEDLARNHLAMGRDKSIYSRASAEIKRLNALQELDRNTLEKVVNAIDDLTMLVEIKRDPIRGLLAKISVWIYSYLHTRSKD